MTRSGVFDRIVCGIDGTPESLEAVRQASALACEDSTLCLFHAVDLAPALAVAWAAPAAASSMSIDAREALDEAAELVPGASTRSVDGPPVACLLEEIERERATLVAVGTHGTPRAEGILPGDDDGGCCTRIRSVLVARAPDEGVRPALDPRGMDGSDESACAAAAALEIGSRLGARAAFGGFGGRRPSDTARTPPDPSRGSLPWMPIVRREGVDLVVAGVEACMAAVARQVLARSPNGVARCCGRRRAEQPGDASAACARRGRCRTLARPDPAQA
jgi:nucleotide-binding universal stress UspA family protein